MTHIKPIVNSRTLKISLLVKLGFNLTFTDKEGVVHIAALYSIIM
jgi:hypothetical protein